VIGSFLTPFLFQSAAQAIAPILLAALAGVLCGRVGVFNLALEGQMLVGAFAAIVGSYFGHSAIVGVAVAMAGAAVFSLILAYGATVSFSDPGVVGLGRITIPALLGAPVIGWAFARQSAVTWAAWALTALISVVLFLTPVGLRLRGVGEQPDAAGTLGVDVARYRIVAVLVAGALTGLAGAQLSLGAVSVFSEDMSAGRGWIAVVAVMLGRNNPLYAAAACVLFGFADAIGVNLQSRGLPNQLTDVAPYAATLLALVISHRHKVRISQIS
jgi:general nucleoside transport system permease protein